MQKSVSPAIDGKRIWVFRKRGEHSGQNRLFVQTCQRARSTREPQSEQKLGLYMIRISLVRRMHDRAGARIGEAVVKISKTGRDYIPNEVSRVARNIKRAGLEVVISGNYRVGQVNFPQDVFADSL
jgi:hypothetical protein